MTKKSYNGAARLRRPPAELARKLLSRFQAEDRVLVIIAADPDALASAMAVRRLLWRRVASVTIARVNEVTRPDNLTMMSLLGIKAVPLAEVDPAAFSKRVMVDSQPHHYQEFPGLPMEVIIDHHPLGDKSAGQGGLVDIRPRYGATSSIMTEYLKGAKITPSVRLATALVYGIKTDTDSFGRASLLEDVQAFQYLFPKANQSTLRKIEFSELRLKDLALLHLALDRFAVRKSTLYVHLGKVASPDNLVQIADFFMRVESVFISVVSGICGNKLVVILRNATYRTNAGKMAEEAFAELGTAGGHPSMARAEISLEALANQCKDLSDDALGLWVQRRLQRSGKAKTKKP
ncbi:MAG: phosphoesterase [Desulfarculus sp.]|jgi:nanoRNase/pAp phosphatase (c-di-AMP/oligoRNAs hydrolase)|nr:MAG: phosphoesterase [Desulfarculus sp.]